MRRPSIALQNVDGSHCRYLGPGEAEELERKGDIRRLAAKPMSKKKRRRLAVDFSRRIVYRLIPHPEPVRSFKEASPPSITRSDMLANVGITPGLGEADRNAMRRARIKIAEFALTSPRHVLPAGDGL